MLKYGAFTIIFFCAACSEQGEESDHHFQSLSLGQLIDLREKSKSMEGFFMTTHLSDVYESGSKIGLYLYVCIRFLNDDDLNKKLKRSAIPLLIQASYVPEKPMAESVFLLYSNDENQLHYSGSEHFRLKSSFIEFEGTEHRIMNVEFNKDHKIINISFIPKDLKMENLEEALDEEDDLSQEEGERINHDDREDENEIQEQIITIGSFAKLHSNSCVDWELFNYDHDHETPEYLKTPVESQGSGSNGESLEKIPDSMVKPIPPSAPHTPVEQQTST